MTDLHTEAKQLNARLAAAKCPVFVRPGKRALQWFAKYRVQEMGNESGYQVGRGEALRTLAAYGVTP